MWYGKFPRAHARCGRFRARVTVRVKGEGLGLGLALWYGKKIREGACTLWKKKKNGGCPAPRRLEEEAAYYSLRTRPTLSLLVAGAFIFGWRLGFPGAF